MLNIIKKKVSDILKSKDQKKLKCVPIKTTVIYIFLSLLWVIINDYVIGEDQSYFTSGIFDEIFFLVISYFVIYALIDSIVENIISQKSLNESYEELSSVYEELAASEEELQQQFKEVNKINIKLQESEDRLKRANRIGLIGNWEYDIINKKIWASVETRQIYGFLVDRDVFPVEFVQSTVIDEDRHLVEAAHRHLIEENTKFDVTYRIIRFDNEEIRNIYAIAETQYNSEGKPVKIIGLIQDITKTVNYEKNLMEKIRGFKRISKLLSESERRLYKAQEIGHVGNWEYNLITKTMWVSKEGIRLFWAENEEWNIPLEYILKFYDPKDRKRIEHSFNQLIENNIEYNLEHKIINPETKQERYIHSIGELEYSKKGKPIKMLGVVKDITNRKNQELNLKNKNEELSALYEQLAASEEELRQQLDEILMNRNLLEVSEERYRTLVDNSQDIIISCDCDSVFIAVNRKFSEIVNLPASKIIGKKFNEIFSNESLINDWNNAITKVINNKEILYEENRYYSGTIYYGTICPIIDSNNNVIGVTATNHDVTQTKKNEEIISNMAYFDHLTGLPNRVLFISNLEKSIEKAYETGRQLIVLFIDMDNFKKVNDTLGHAYGDDFLKECAKRLQLCMGKSDFVARLSGDEFAVLIQDIYFVEDVSLTIKTILDVFQEPFHVGNSLINMSASIGAAVFPQDGNNASDLLISADTAMYKAKERGKNSYEFFNINMKNELIKKLNIEALLRKAIVRNEFLLYYQPQYNVKYGRLRGLEALIRWKNPELGFMNPIDFIPTAEETGLITEIGQWVLNTACDFGKKLNDRYLQEIIIAVNISPIQLKNNNFYSTVIDAIKRSGIKPSNLELEVTENIFIDNFEYAISVLNDLKQFGVRIALDDFGTGFSSLSYLKKLPINLLKIDKSFINEIDILNPRNDFTNSIISLVHKLDIEALAEGVENQFQYDYLVNADIDNIQGYYMGKPLPEEDIEKILF